MADERLPAQVRGQVEVRAKYAGYIERHRRRSPARAAHEETVLPPDMDYARSPDSPTRCARNSPTCGPATLGQAARIPGVTPAAVSILLVHLKKRARRRARVA